MAIAQGDKLPSVPVLKKGAEGLETVDLSAIPGRVAISRRTLASGGVRSSGTNASANRAAASAPSWDSSNVIPVGRGTSGTVHHVNRSTVE